MAKFMFMFRGGTVPKEQYEQHAKDWNAWFEVLGATAKIVDGGAPFGQNSKVVVAGGEARDYNWETDSNVNGYCVVDVANIDEALALTKDCPALDLEFIDGTVEVRELSAM